MFKGDEYDRARGYRDGCEAAVSCLECPLERCIDEVPRGRQRYLRERRDALIAELRRQGKGTGEIAREIGVSRRTVQRALKCKVQN